MGFFSTLATGYGILFKNFSGKFGQVAPKVFSGCGSGLMMIGSAVMAKTAMKEDTQKVIAEANKDVEEAKASKNKKYIIKAKAQKTWKVVKVFRKGVALEVGGAVCNGIGIGLSERGRTKALTACAAIGAQFAGYRAAVRDDLGSEADIRYMTGQKAVKKTEKIDKKTGEVTNELEYIQDDDGVTIKKDPNAFRFWFSRETCPSIWVDNFDLRKAKLECIEANLSMRLMDNKHLSLNDMRREFGGYNPSKMDVGIGGIFGRVWEDGKPSTHKLIDLHFRDDKEFMEGRTDSCWIVFDCDPEPIVGKIKPKLTEVKI